MKFNYLDLCNQKCPVCDGDLFSILNRNDRYFMRLVIVGCNICGMIQTNPRPTEAGLVSFYKNDYRKFYQDVISPDQDYINQHNKQERLQYTICFLKNLVSYLPAVSILDVGCSEGALFSAFRGDGFVGALFGVELNQEFASYAEKKSGAKVYPTLAALTEPCNLIVVNHVFEHLLKPCDFLENIKYLMKKDGFLYIDVPDACEYRSLDDLHLAHIFHYTTRTLTRLVERWGFDVISCEKHNPPFHPKSIRLVAKKREVPGAVCTNSSPVTELAAWSRVKRISPIRRKFRILVSRIPFAKRIYKVLNRFSTTN